MALAKVLPAGSFRRRLRRLIETEEAATLESAVDGMVRLTASLPAVEAHAVFDRLTRMAKAMTGRGRRVDRTRGEGADDRSLDQARADVLCDLLIDGVCADHDAVVRGIRPTAVVTVPVLSVGRTRYDPPPELRRLVRWRAERCLAPGCTVPASRCEIDHARAWVDGGETSLDNLAPLCTGHHHVKHSGGWSVSQVAGSGGVMEWISPTGRRYLVEPERRVPVFQTTADNEPAPF